MNTLTTSQAGLAITPPSDFPVCWPNPSDAQIHWTRDREHLPAPITPMFNSIASATAPAGRRRTISVYDEAILERRDCTINHYDYIHLQPFLGDSKDLEVRARSNRQKLMAAAAQLTELWQNDWLPRIETCWDFWRNFDLEHASLELLAAHLKGSLQPLTDLYEVHYLMGPPMWFAIDEFEKFYCDLFPGSSPLDAQRLLQGFDNITLQITRSLWSLSRLALAAPTITAKLRSQRPEAVLPTLALLPEANSFVTSLQKFLATYGRRSDLWDWGYPSWEDNPLPVINQLKLYIAQPERDLEAELAETARQREQAVAIARQSLANHPRPIKARFEILLSAAQFALVLTENHTYYIDFNGFGWMHRVVRACGKRLVELNCLHSADDAFYLEWAELYQALCTPKPALAEYAASRRQEVEYWAAYDAPSELGIRPSAPIYLYSADARRMLRYAGGFAADAIPASAPEDSLLRGQPGSAGKITGKARRILSLADAHLLQPGEILVCTTTAPPWTPLFLTAAGLVTDAGGLLSHGAVVAREYRLPAVVGTRYATQTIQSGQLIQVDGNAGTVTILK